jgi:tetratricopeptide (TPR) repeat protein
LDIMRGQTERQSEALEQLAWIHWQRGNYADAQGYAKESQRLARESAQSLAEAKGLHIESLCWYSLGHYGPSILLLKRARALIALASMTEGEVDLEIMNSQAEIYRAKSEYVEARKVQTHILQNFFTRKCPYDHGFALLKMAQIDVDIGAPRDDVEWEIQQATMMFNSMGTSRGLTGCEIIRATLNAEAGNMGEARQSFKECLALMWGREVDLMSSCLERLADVDRSWGGQRSCNSTVTFIVHSLKLGQRLEIYKAFQLLADLFLACSDHDTAKSLLSVALDGFTDMDVHCSRAECMLRIGDIAKLDGEMLKAAELWKGSRPLFEQSSQVKRVACIDQKLSVLDDNTAAC